MCMYVVVGRHELLLTASKFKGTAWEDNVTLFKT